MGCPWCVSQGSKELGVGTIFLSIVGPMMSGIDCFLLAVAAAKGNH